MAFDRPLPASKYCRHYDYEDGPRCSAGVDMSAPKSHLPCMPSWQETGVTCDWREEFTPVEREAWERWRVERQARMALIMPMVPGSSIDKINKPEWGNRGEFDCPACNEGKVRWARAVSNGHLHAACTTSGCFEVIE